MKKNISINLQGIIFHIEEDGYEQLSRYLASIRTYFSNYEGHEEIIADIEYRIAEIFSARLVPGKQVISLEDVQYLIARMGDVTDFEVLDPMDDDIPYTTTATAGAGTRTESHTYTGPKKLYRDITHKVIAGVCAGIANYLNVDPVWMRLFFIFLVAIAPLTAGISVAFIVIVYIILWISMPPNDLLPETTVKKLFRDPEDKKLAGVCAGIAKYFGVDVAVIRIIFLALIFAGGFGLIAYIVLWIAVPEAVTLTERMQMQGDPVTLAGIEKTLKDNLNMKDSNGQESTLARVILLPVRLISQIFSWLGRALGPILAFLITLIRIGAGVFLLVLAIGLTIALLTTLFYTLGWIAEPQNISFGDYPASVFLEGFPRLGLVAGFFVGIIPLILLMFLGIGLLTKRFFLRAIVGWSMFGLWLVSVFILILCIASYAGNFKRSGEVITNRIIPVSNYETLTLDAYDINTDYDNIYVDVREADGDNVEIIQNVEAKGRTEAQAQANARMITYRVVQKDSVLRFDNGYEFKPGAAYRDQDLEIKLLLPKNKKLRLTEDFVNMLPGATFDQDYSHEKIARNTWQVKGDMLTCLTCATDTLDTENDNNRNDDDFNINMDVDAFSDGESVLLDESAYSENVRNFNYSNFEHISIGGPYHVQLTQGGNYSVRVHASNEEMDKMEIKQNGNELVISYEDNTINLFDDREPILIQITAPNINEIDLSGAIKADVNGITSNNLDVSLTGATKAAFNVRTQNLKADITGASASRFVGHTDVFDLNAAGACSIDAGQMSATQVEVDAAGMTVVEVYVTSELRAEASGASQIKYDGNPGITRINANGASKVEHK
ncbi:PspC domain-containing protein [Pontibacter sp. 172403-2]|uniref:PspC domain-containing protein n=1 Tax=Pontibacter rufus TaxID=2791028 RepID=UPI0018AFE9F2|nr:PspC domain-containing protein [Pontibacter sp. 172403-2]MBF9255376.1 PspC domain-containing protein [Pontibacter sp. 172403-2]